MKIELTKGDLRLLFLLHDDKTLAEISAALDTDNGALYMRLRRLRHKFGARTTHGMIAKAARLHVFAEQNRPRQGSAGPLSYPSAGPSASGSPPQ